MEQLRAIPFFSNLPTDALNAVAVKLRHEEVPSPRVIFQKGDTGRWMYFLSSGQVLIEAPGGEAIALLGPGSFFGEMSLLLDSPRSADARAITPCELLILEMDDLEELMGSYPSIGIEIGRELSRRLATTSQRVHKVVDCRLVGVLGERMDSLVAGLVRNSGMAPAVCSLAELITPSRDLIDPWETLERAWEHIRKIRFHADPYVLLSIPDPDSPVGQRAVRMCDRVIEMRPGEHPARNESTMRCDGSADSLARVARWIGGRSIALALSSGGSKTVAHLGVVEELAARRIPIDGVAGSSGGALVAAGVAMEVPVKQQLKHLQELTRALKVYRWDLNIVPRAAIIKGRKLRDMFDRWLEGRHFEDLPIPLYIAAADLDTAETVILHRGSVADAIRASLSVPGVLDPWKIDERLLIDGGVVDPLPGAVLKGAGFGRVIGSNVAGKQFDAIARLDRPNLVQIMTRMVHLMESRVVGAQALHIDLMIRPRVSASATFDFRMIERFVEEGRSAAKSALESWHIDLTLGEEALSTKPS